MTAVHTRLITASVQAYEQGDVRKAKQLHAEAQSVLERGIRRFETLQVTNKKEAQVCIR